MWPIGLFTVRVLIFPDTRTHYTWFAHLHW